jgi:hypothetical protein
VSDAYEPSDPKSDGYHDRLADVWDLRDKTEPARSAGHLAFIPDTHGGYWEYFRSEDGQHVYRQTTSAPVMPDGRRSGRWYCPWWQWEKRETS